MKVDTISFTGAYKVNPEFYELQIDSSAPWPEYALGQMLQINDDPRAWKIVRIDGCTATVRWVELETQH